MLERQPNSFLKLEDNQMLPFTNQVKIESEASRRAHYIKMKEIKKRRRNLQIFAKTGALGAYFKCDSKNRQAEELQSKSRRAIFSRRRKNSSDDDYNVKNQKKDRNVTSNLIHHLMKYLTTVEGLDAIVASLIASRRISISLVEFQQRLQFQDKALKTYVTVKHIKELWFSDNPDKKQFCKVMRILSRYFLCNQAFLSIYFSNKFNRNSKITHYKGLRSLIEVLSRKDFDQLRFSEFS